MPAEEADDIETRGPNYRLLYPIAVGVLIPLSAIVLRRHRVARNATIGALAGSILLGAHFSAISGTHQNK